MSGKQEQPTRHGLVVGIGASAGGLEAFTAFFAHLPPDSGMAFVLVQHLSPNHESALTEILSLTAPIPVVAAQQDMRVEPNRVYVIPPDATLTIKDSRLRVIKPAPAREHRRPIDSFFASLAKDQGDNAVSIVLSGVGSDGAAGLAAVKESGGLTIAQAEFDHHAMPGMPQNAAATGLVDYVMQVEEMPAKLIEYRDYLALVADRKDGDGTRIDAAEHLETVLSVLRAKTGHDFAKYKIKTVTRRIQRRMQVLQADTVPAYIKHLREDPAEPELLFRDLLIGVTEFFRDPEAFNGLSAAIGAILDRSADVQSLRGSGRRPVRPARRSTASPSPFKNWSARAAQVLTCRFLARTSTIGRLSSPGLGATRVPSVSQRNACSAGFMKRRERSVRSGRSAKCVSSPSIT